MFTEVIYVLIRENYLSKIRGFYNSNLIKIFENELTKSPKDRLIRLSRESIRKEIARFNSLIPNIKTQKNQKALQNLPSAAETQVHGSQPSPTAQHTFQQLCSSATQAAQAGNTAYGAYSPV